MFIVIRFEVFFIVLQQTWITSQHSVSNTHGSTDMEIQGVPANVFSRGCNNNTNTRKKNENTVFKVNDDAVPPFHDNNEE